MLTQTTFGTHAYVFDHVYLLRISFWFFLFSIQVHHKNVTIVPSFSIALNKIDMKDVAKNYEFRMKRV